MPSVHDTKNDIAEALAGFGSKSLAKGATAFLNALDYRSNRSIASAGSSPKAFLDLFDSGRTFDEKKALVDEWKTADLLFQLKDHFYRDSWDSKMTYPSILVKSVKRYSYPTFERGIKFDYDLASEITKHTQKSAIVLQKYSPYLNRNKLVIRQSAPLIIATLAQPDCRGEYSLFSCILSVS